MILRKNITKVEKEAEQPVEIEQLADFSLTLVKGRFFNVEANSSNIHVVVPTKMRFKFIMRCKGKEQVEEGNSPTKVTQKQLLAKTKEIQKML